MNGVSPLNYLLGNEAFGPKESGGGEGGVVPNIQATAETLPAGSEATVTRTGSDTNPVFHFGIPEGEPGAQGPVGATGPTGATGAPGPQGIQGIPGPAGTDGATGPEGPAGAQGVQGPQGKQGDPFLIQKVYDTVADMNAGYAMDGLPQGALVGISTETGGEDGGKLYIKGAAAYEFFFNLANVDGIDGPQGPAGPQGPVGPAGETGPQGPAGAKGETGAQGPTGETGATGPKGDKGDPGEQGPTGEPGAKGDPGPGVPSGGSPGQLLTKKTAADYDTQWSDPAGGGADINTGDGLSKDGDTISVDNPVRGVYTQAEYDALTEAQKAKGTYFLGDGGTDAAKLLRIISNGGALGLPVGPMGPAGPDGNPIGSIISYMGVTAPKDYLICNGATYPIADYPDLADFFQAQFGSKNYFGGNGTTTFAVPDMRNLFLRGYHGEADEQLSGAVGVKQGATEHLRVTAINDTLHMASAPGLNYYAANPDSTKQFSNPNVTSVGGQSNTTIAYSTYTSRPVNMAVLYCIKAVDSSLTGDIYSLEEREVGRWFDGRPVYRITAVVKSPTTLLVWGKVNAPIPNAEGKFLGVSMIDNSGTVSAFPMVQDNYFIKAVYSNDGVGFPDGAGFYVYNNRNSWANQLLILNLYYTKTTDQPTIELPAALTPANTQTLYKAAPQSAAAVTLDAGIKTKEV